MSDTPVIERDRKLRRLDSGILANRPVGLSDDHLDYLLANLDKVGQAVHDGIIGVLPSPVSTGEDWIDQPVAKEAQCLKDRFGQSFDMTLLVDTLKSYGREKIERWQGLDLAVGYLPLMVLAQKAKIRNWKRPEAWFWDQLREGKLYRRNADGKLGQITSVGLEGIVVLYDTRPKPAYDNAKQMYANDEVYMAPIIRKLRKDRKIQSHQDVPDDSRFYISSLEWDKHLRGAVAEFLGLPIEQVRLETEIEANLIPQIYRDTPRAKDGTTNTSEWREEYFRDESYRLIGGNSDYGGLAFVSYFDVDARWRNGAIRPLGVLATG